MVPVDVRGEESTGSGVAVVLPPPPPPPPEPPVPPPPEHPPAHANTTASSAPHDRWPGISLLRDGGGISARSPGKVSCRPRGHGQDPNRGKCRTPKRRGLTVRWVRCKGDEGRSNRIECTREVPAPFGRWQKVAPGASATQATKGVNGTKGWRAVSSRPNAGPRPVTSLRFITLSTTPIVGLAPQFAESKSWEAEHPWASFWTFVRRTKFRTGVPVARTAYSESGGSRERGFSGGSAPAP